MCEAADVGPMSAQEAGASEELEQVNERWCSDEEDDQVHSAAHLDGGALVEPVQGAAWGVEHPGAPYAAFEAFCVPCPVLVQPTDAGACWFDMQGMLYPVATEDVSQAWDNTAWPDDTAAWYGQGRRGKARRQAARAPAAKSVAVAAASSGDAAAKGGKGPISVGSAGHPMCCGRACKYFWKPKGCKDGANCSRCHICAYSRAEERQFGQPAARQFGQTAARRKAF